MYKRKPSPLKGMQRARRFGTRLIVALPLTLAVAGTTTITTSIVDAPPAAAWGLGDIKKAAKKVGGAVKKGAKKAAKKGKYVAKHGGKIAGGLAKDAYKGAKTANDAINYVPRTIQKGARDTALGVVGKAWARTQGQMTDTYANIRGINTPEYQKQTREAEQASRDFVSGLGQRADRYLKGAKRKARKALTEGVTSGESRPRGGSTQKAIRRTQSTKSLQVRTIRRNLRNSDRSANRRSSGTLRPGVVNDRKFRGSKPSTTIKTGVVRDKKFRGSNPTTNRRPIGNDKSIWGRPVGGKQQAGGKHKIGNDKSVYGRPVYGKRPNKRGPNRKVQGIRLGDIKGGVKRTPDIRKKNAKFSKDRKFKRDRKRMNRDRKFKRNKRLTRDRKFKRNKRVNRDRKRMSRKFRNNRKSRGFRMKRNRNRGNNNRRRNNRRNR